MHPCDGHECWSYWPREGESSFEGHPGASSGSGVLPGLAAGGSGAGSGLGASSGSGAGSGMHPYVGHARDAG